MLTIQFESFRHIPWRLLQRKMYQSSLTPHQSFFTCILSNLHVSKLAEIMNIPNEIGSQTWSAGLTDLKMKLTKSIFFSFSAVQLAFATATCQAKPSQADSHSCPQITPFVQQHPHIDYDFDPKTITGHLRRPGINLMSTPIPTVGFWEEDTFKFHPRLRQINAACPFAAASTSSPQLPENTAGSSVPGLVNISTETSDSTMGPTVVVIPPPTSGAVSRFRFLNILERWKKWCRWPNTPYFKRVDG
jgi:hypothetical protein